MIVWGGSDDHEGEARQGCPATFAAAGAAYDPVSDEWRTIAESPLEPRGWHRAVWTGEEMIVWGGGGGNCAEEPRSDGARYDPSSDRWRRIADAPLSGREEHSAVWTGEEMMVWGGSTNGRSVTFDGGAVYRPDSDSWAPLPAAPIDSRALHGAVWTGKEMVVWGGCCNVTPEFTDAFRDGAVYSP